MDNGCFLTKVCFSASRASHLCKLQSTSTIGVTRSVTQGVTHFLRHTWFFPVQDFTLSMLSAVYATQSEQKWPRSLIWGFDVCTLDGDVFVDLAKSADAS